MRHIRVDNEELNANRRFGCGIGPELPDGDSYIFAGETGLHHTVDCKGCNPHQKQLGTPIAELSTEPGTLGFEKFKSIASSWGYD